MRIIASILLGALCCPLWAQYNDNRLKVDTSIANTFKDATSVRTFDDADVIVFDGEGTVAKIGLIEIETAAANVAVEIYNQKREPVEYLQLNSRTYGIVESGKHWIDVTAIDFEQNIYVRKIVTLSIGPQPEPEPGPEPGPGPGPEPEPEPNVPEDRFNNIGQRVAALAEGLPSNAEVGAVYADCAKQLEEGDPSLEASGIFDVLKEKLSRITEVSQYKPVGDIISSDVKANWDEGWQLKYKKFLAEYLQAVSKGFRV